MRPTSIHTWAHCWVSPWSPTSRPASRSCRPRRCSTGRSRSSARLAARLAADGPVALAIEDLHWADATSLQLLQRLAADTDSEALLLVMTSRPERDHGVWRLKEDIGRELPHRVWELTLDALSGDAGRELLNELVGAGTLPRDTERRILELAEGNPFFLEEIVRSLADAGALVHDGQGGWTFGHEVPVEIPATVEKVILARIDRLEGATHEALVAASVLGRQFGLPLLEGVADRTPEEVRAALNELQRLDLVRQGRRWPEPEFRFKHALIQDAAYRTLVREHRNRLHRKAAEWLGRQYAGREDEVAGLLAHHWLGAEDEDRATVYLTRAGDRAREEYGLDEAIVHYRQLLPILERRGQRREIALVLFKLALALHMTLRFAEANETYQRAFDRWDVPSPTWPSKEAGATIRIGTSFLPDDPDPRSAIAWPNIQLGMHLFDRLVEAWPERTIVPSLAERWEISDDGLRYVFHLRDGLHVVRRPPADRPRRRVRHQARAGPGCAGLLGRDLLRARTWAGLLPTTHRRRGGDRRARARRPHRRVSPRRAGPVLHERDEPARRRVRSRATPSRRPVTRGLSTRW